MLEIKLSSIQNEFGYIKDELETINENSEDNYKTPEDLDIYIAGLEKTISALASDFTKDLVDSKYALDQLQSYLAKLIAAEKGKTYLRDELQDTWDHIDEIKPKMELALEQARALDQERALRKRLFLLEMGTMVEELGKLVSVYKAQTFAVYIEKWPGMIDVCEKEPAKDVMDFKDGILEAMGELRKFITVEVNEGAKDYAAAICRWLKNLILTQEWVDPQQIAQRAISRKGRKPLERAISEKPKPMQIIDLAATFWRSQPGKDDAVMQGGAEFETAKNTYEM